MKKLPLILSIISLVGVIAIFATIMSQHGQKAKNEISENSFVADSSLKIAYILSDSVLVNYQLALDLNEEFIEHQKQFTEEFNKKRIDLEQQAVAFQQKVQRGGFLTQDRAEQERNRLLEQEQQIKQLDYEMSNKLAEMEAKMNAQLVDSIVNYVKVYNKKHNYTYILSNNGNIIVGAPQLNISKAIVDGLNRRYKNSK